MVNYTYQNLTNGLECYKILHNPTYIYIFRKMMTKAKPSKGGDAKPRV